MDDNLSNKVQNVHELLNFLKSNPNSFSNDFINKFEKDLNELSSKVLATVISEQKQQCNHSYVDFSDSNSTNGKSTEVIISKNLPSNLRKPDNSVYVENIRKDFVPRESVLTEIFATSHGSALYRMCMVFSIFTLGCSAAFDYLSNQGLNIGQDLIWLNAKSIPLTMLTWLVIVVLVGAVYALLYIWGKFRKSLNVIPVVRLMWDTAFVALVCVLMVLYLALPTATTILLDLAPVCSFAVLMQLMHYFSKIWALLRLYIPRVTNDRPIPTFNSIMYFLVVPTLVYKDSYPRSDKLRWSVACQHLLELVWAVVMSAYFMSRVHVPAFSDFRSVWLDGVDALITYCSITIPTIVLLLLGFFSYFHSFCNLQAEVTGFADRLFYKDWWNCTSFQGFFTSWNVLVQDWLFHYIYLDIKALTGSRVLGVAGVFAVSGIVHEFVLSLFFRFFYPVLIILFVGVGLILKAIQTAKVSPSFGNICLWICLPLGSSIICAAYMAEYFSRINCPYPDEGPTLLDYFIPRSWSCPLTG